MGLIDCIKKAGYTIQEAEELKKGLLKDLGWKPRGLSKAERARITEEFINSQEKDLIGIINQVREQVGLEPVTTDLIKNPINAQQESQEAQTQPQEASEVSETNQSPIQETNEATEAQAPDVGDIKRGKRTYRKDEDGNWRAVKKDGDLYKNAENSSKIIEELDRKERILQERINQKTNNNEGENTTVSEGQQRGDVQGSELPVQESEIVDSAVDLINREQDLNKTIEDNENLTNSLQKEHDRIKNKRDKKSNQRRKDIKAEIAALESETSSAKEELKNIVNLRKTQRDAEIKRNQSQEGTQDETSLDQDAERGQSQEENVLNDLREKADTKAKKEGIKALEEIQSEILDHLDEDNGLNSDALFSKERIEGRDKDAKGQEITSKSQLSGKGGPLYTSIRLLLPTMQKMGFSVVLHENPDSMINASIEAGIDPSYTQGFLDNEKRQIHVYEKGSKTTFAHEAMHPFVAYMIKNDPEVFSQFLNKLRTDSVIGSELAQFASQYSELAQDKELVVEGLATKLVDNFLTVSLEKPSLIKKLVSGAMKLLGFKPSQTKRLQDLILKSKGDVDSFAYAMAQAIIDGKTITIDKRTRQEQERVEQSKKSKRIVDFVVMPTNNKTLFSRNPFTGEETVSQATSSFIEDINPESLRIIPVDLDKIDVQLMSARGLNDQEISERQFYNDPHQGFDFAADYEIVHDGQRLGTIEVDRISENVVAINSAELRTSAYADDQNSLQVFIEAVRKVLGDIANRFREMPRAMGMSVSINGGLGIGEQAYTKIGEIANNYGLRFQSDLIRSDAAEGLWRKLERKGKAKKVPANFAIPINDENRNSYLFEYIPESNNTIEESRMRKRVSKSKAIERLRQKATKFKKAGITAEMLYAMNPAKWQQIGMDPRQIQAAMETVGTKKSDLAETINLQGIAYLTPEQKRELATVTSQTNVVSDKQAETIIKEYGEQAILDKIIRDRKDKMSIDMMTILAQKLIKRFEAAGRHDLSTSAMEQLFELANETGRGLHFHKLWREMSPEGFIYTAKKVSDRVRKIVVEDNQELAEIIFHGAQKGYSRAVNKAVNAIQKNLQNKLEKEAKDNKGPRAKRLKDIEKRLNERFGKEQSLANGKFPDGLTEDDYRDILEIAAEGVENHKVARPFQMRQFVQNWLAQRGINLTMSDELQDAIWDERYNNIKIKDRARILHKNLLQTLEDANNMESALQDMLGISKAEAKDLLEQVDFKGIIEQEYKASVADLGKRVGEAKGLMALIAGNPNMTRQAIEEALMEKLSVKSKLTPQEEAKIRELAERIQNIPGGSELLRDEATAHLLSEMEKSFGPDAIKYLSREKDSLAWSLFYASILSGFGTQVLNIIANFFKGFMENAILSLLVAKDPRTRAQALRNWAVLLEQLKPLLNPVKRVTGIGTPTSTRATREFWSILAEGRKRSDRDSIKFFDESALERANKEVKEMESIYKELKKDPIGASAKLTAVVAKYVPRFMSATDAYFFWANYYAKAESYMAVSLAKQDLSYSEINAEINKAFKQEYTQFVAQARDELTKPNAKGVVPLRLDGKPFNETDILRRADELMENFGSGAVGANLYQETRDKATQFARTNTFTQKPEGIFGVAADTINSWHRSKNWKVSLLSRMIAPFTTVVANVVNDQLDYMVHGNKDIIKSIAKGPAHIIDKLFGTDVVGKRNLNVLWTDGKRQVVAKNLVGLTLMITALAMFSAFDEDDDDWFIKVHGAGPKGPQSFQDLMQLRASGWQPHSIEIGDGFFITYREVGPGLLLSLIGNLFDSKRYGKKGGSEADVKSTLGYFVDSSLATPGVIMEASFVRGIADFTTILADSTKDGSGVTKDKMLKWMVRQPRVIIPNFIRSISSSFDPTWYQTKDMGDYIYKQYVWPLTGNALAPEMLGKESLVPYYTSLGDKVTFGAEGTLPSIGRVTGLSRFFNIAPKDKPIYDFLIEKNIYISGLGYQTQHEGVKLWQDNKEAFIEVNNERGKLIKEYLRKAIDGKYKRMTVPEIRADVKKAVSGQRTNSFSTQAKENVLGKPSKRKKRKKKR